MDLTITLKKPVEAHGQTIEQIHLTEPTGQHVVKLGEPFLLVAGGGIREMPEITVNYIVKLAKIPRSSAEALAPSDRKKVFMYLLPFLMPEDTEDQAETADQDD